MKSVFWLSLVFVFYTYIGYPLLLALKKRFSSNSLLLKKDQHGLSEISVVIAAHNEGEGVARRVEDIRRQKYPHGKIEIIVVSDGSTDNTLDELRKLCCENLKILALPINQGKAMALNAGVAEASGEVVVFTDVRQTFEPNAIYNLSQTFVDPSVGCVSGELIFLQDANSTIQSEMGAYWKYEKWIRKTESLTGSSVGATGAIYAIRRRLYLPLPSGTILDDVLTPLNIAMQGYRCLFNSEAVAYDVLSKDIAQEWKRKVRTLAGNWQLLSLSPRLLLPWKNPLWWRFFSHKIFRLLVPMALVVLFITSTQAIGLIYDIGMVSQVLFYAVSLAPWGIPAARKNRFINVSYFFMVMNLAALFGFWIWASGHCNAAWRK